MSKPRFHIAVKNQIQDNSLELYFLDFIYDGFDWNTYTEISMVSDTIAKVKAANPSKIKLVIDSQGGNCQIGLAIYNFLKSYNAEVEVEIIGMAGSIATVLAMSANKGKLKIARNGFFVIHRAWGSGFGNSEDLRAAADVIDMYTAQIVDIYAQRTGKKTEDINTLIATGDYWMSGSDAVEQGFADEVLTENSAFQIAARIGTLDPNYRNIPKNLSENNATILSSIQTSFMNILDQFKAALGKFSKTADNPTPEAMTPDALIAALTPALTSIQASIDAAKPAAAVATPETPAAPAAVVAPAAAPAAPAAVVAPAAAPAAPVTAPAADVDFAKLIAAQAETIKQLQADVANKIGGATVAPAAPVTNAIGSFA